MYVKSFVVVENISAKRLHADVYICLLETSQHFFNGFITDLAQHHSVNSSTSAQPMILDSTGNMRPDLLGFAYASGEPDSTTAPVLPTVWENTWESSNGTSIFSTSCVFAEIFHHKFDAEYFYGDES